MVCRAPESNWARLPLPKQFGLYHSRPAVAGYGIGRLREVIVGTHSLVSTPAFAKATAGKSSKNT